MKRLSAISCLTLAFAIIAAANAFAANRGSVTIFSPLKVAGRQLTAGTYNVGWKEDGAKSEMTILKGKKAIVETPIAIVPLQAAPSFDSTVVNTDAAGGHNLFQVLLAGKKFALQVQIPSEPQGAGTGR